MEIEAVYVPMFENDMFLLKIPQFSLNNEDFEKLKFADEYLYVKSRAFSDQNIKKETFGHFKDRPSFRNFEKLNKLEGTIYTYAVEDRNGIGYNQAIYLIKNMMKINPSTKRCVLRIANSFPDYYLSEISGKDVSCLSIVHYKRDSVCLMFRASDVANELFIDLITIYEFFIKPVTELPIDIEIFSSSGQNINKFDDFVKQVKNL